MAMRRKNVNKKTPVKGKKPVYRKKKEAKQTPISNKEFTEKHKDFKPSIVEPSEKYISTIQAIKNKKFFVDAQFGNKIFWESILEFHVDKKDVPVLLCNAKYRNKRGDLVSEKKVYRIIRYNEKEIIGINSQNINIWMSKTIDVSKFIKE